MRERKHYSCTEERPTYASKDEEMEALGKGVCIVNACINRHLKAKEE